MKLALAFTFSTSITVMSVIMDRCDGIVLERKRKVINKLVEAQQIVTREHKELMIHSC